MANKQTVIIRRLMTERTIKIFRLWKTDTREYTNGKYIPEI